MKEKQNLVHWIDFVFCMIPFSYLGVRILLKVRLKDSLVENTGFFFSFFRPTHFNNIPQAVDNSFIKKLQSSGRSLIVFYGSQTGTGEEFASRIAKEGTKYGMKGMVADPEECDMVSLSVFFAKYFETSLMLSLCCP